MKDEITLRPPSDWVTRFATLIRPGGKVLDLACGRGRHARFLAEQGFQVVAVDKDEEALATMAGIPGIRTVQADLENRPWPVFGELFTGIIVTNYLWRQLVPMMFSSLEVDGVLIQETFMLGHERFGKPSNPTFLLRPGELLETARQRLTVIAFEQGEVKHPRPAIMQRLCAVRGGVGQLPSATCAPPVAQEAAAANN